MNRRTPWSEMDADDIHTPPHAQTAWPVESKASPIDAAVMPPPPSPPSRLKPVMVWSLVISLAFMFVLILFFYQHEHFIPITISGSIGVLMLSVFILWDWMPVPQTE